MIEYSCWEFSLRFSALLTSVRLGGAPPLRPGHSCTKADEHQLIAAGRRVENLADLICERIPAPPRDSSEDKTRRRRLRRVPSSRVRTTVVPARVGFCAAKRNASVNE